MKKKCTDKSRRQMKRKMAKVFGGKIQMLSTELQEILLDDLVTAFENRLNVLNRAQLDVQCLTEMTGIVEFETF